VFETLKKEQGVVGFPPCSSAKATAARGWEGVGRGFSRYALAYKPLPANSQPAAPLPEEGIKKTTIQGFEHSRF